MLTPTMPPRPARAAEPRQHHRFAVAVEAEPVDHAAIGFEPENARPRIAGLRQRRDGADLDKAEAQAEQRVGHLGVLVEAGRDTDRIWEVEAEGPHPQPRIIGRGLQGGGDPQAPDGKRMGGFRIEKPQQRPGQTIKKANHHGLRMKKAADPIGHNCVVQGRTGQPSAKAIIPTRG